VWATWENQIVAVTQLGFIVGQSEFSDKFWWRPLLLDLKKTCELMYGIHRKYGHMYIRLYFRSVGLKTATANRFKVPCSVTTQLT